MWTRIRGFLSQQKDDAVDGTKFVTENLKGNNPSASPTRRQFLKGLGAAGVSGYAVVEGAENVLDPLQVSYGEPAGDQNGGAPENGNSGSNGDQNSGSSTTDGAGTTTEDYPNHTTTEAHNGTPEDSVDDIYNVLDDSGDSDIEIMEDWLKDGYQEGYSVDDVVMGQDSSGQEYLAFSKNGETDMTLRLRKSQGYSDSEVEALREYAEEGKLDEVLEAAVE